MTSHLDISLKTWLTREEAAGYLGISEKFLDTERAEGKISYLVRKGDSRRPMVRFERVKLDEYMRRHFEEIKSTDDMREGVKARMRKG